MAMYAKVRRMRFRDGVSISEIARRTSLSRNTIKGWLWLPRRSEMTYRRSPVPKKMGPIATVLRQALEADARRPRRERRTAQKLQPQLQADGFAGSYARGTEFIRAWRAAQGAVCE
jgi:transposase-like protein